MYLGKQRKLVKITSIGDPGGILGSQLQPAPVLAIAAIWRMNQTDARSLFFCLSVTLSSKWIKNKPLKKIKFATGSKNVQHSGEALIIRHHLHWTYKGLHLNIFILNLILSLGNELCYFLDASITPEPPEATNHAKGTLAISCSCWDMGSLCGIVHNVKYH